MKTVATSHPETIARNTQWLRVAAVGLAALLLLAAATDQRNTIVDRSSGVVQQIGQQVSPPSTEAMVQDMLMHD